MRCKHCNARLAAHDIWCVECGRQSSVPRQELSALNSLKSSWADFVEKKSHAVPIASVSIILGFLPLAFLTWLFRSYIELPSVTGLQVIVSLLIKAVSYSIFMPFLMLPMTILHNGRDLGKLKSLFAAMKEYPKYLALSLVINFVFVAFYIICFGLPKFGSDPILRLVWLVLINYWSTIFIPAAVLVNYTSSSPISAIKQSYKHFHDVRWNIYLMILILTLINALAAVLALIGLVITIPFTWFALRAYVRKLVDFELLEYRR